MEKKHYKNEIPQQLLQFFVLNKRILNSDLITPAIENGLKHLVIEEKEEIVKEVIPLSEEKQKKLNELLESSKTKGLPQATEEEIRKARENLNKVKKEETFSEMLFGFIDRNNLKDSDVYNNAKVDRRTFSKIRNDKNYHPNMNTIIKLGLSLHLNIMDFEKLLNSANYSMPYNNYFYITIIYCINKKIYDVDQINDILYACELPLL